MGFVGKYQLTETELLYSCLFHVCIIAYVKALSITLFGISVYAHWHSYTLHLERKGLVTVVVYM